MWALKILMFARNIQQMNCVCSHREGLARVIINFVGATDLRSPEVQTQHVISLSFVFHF